MVIFEEKRNGTKKFTKNLEEKLENRKNEKGKGTENYKKKTQKFFALSFTTDRSKIQSIFVFDLPVLKNQKKKDEAFGRRMTEKSIQQELENCEKKYGGKIFSRAFLPLVD